MSDQFGLHEFEKGAAVSHQFETKPEVLIANLSFSHIIEIMVIDDAFERFFCFNVYVTFARQKDVRRVYVKRNGKDGSINVIQKNII